MTKSARKRSCTRSTITFTEPSMTQQEFAEESDINTIMSRYSYSDVSSYVASSGSNVNYLDLSDPIDFQLNQEAIIKANEAFADLPAAVRDRFSNNPVAFLEFVHNPDNREEMLRLGMLNEVANDSSNSSSAEQKSNNAEGAAPIST